MKVKDYATLQTRVGGERVTIVRSDHASSKGPQTVYAAGSGVLPLGVTSAPSLAEVLAVVAAVAS